MKTFIFPFIFIELLNLSFSLVPIWNIESSSILLDGTEEITIHSKDNYPPITLKKKFSNVNGNIEDQNYISVCNKPEQKTDWENIGVSNQLNEWGNVLCPYGRNFLQTFDEEQNKFKSIKPSNFDSENNIKDENDWELSCYHIGKRNFYFQGFLEQDKIRNFYGYYYKNYKSESPNSKKIEDGFDISLLDFMLTKDYNTDENNSEYNMSSLYIQDSNVYANRLLLIINPQNILFFNSGDGGKKYLDYKKTFTYGYFNLTTKLFYWMSTSKDNNYSSGRSLDVIGKEAKNIKIIKNNTSPLQFLQNVTINKIKMIRNTRFAYYELKSIDDNNTYYGIIDIEMNQVIFNTNETLKIFKPLKTTSMLAITEDNKIYQICLNRNGYKGECIESCPNGKILILDSEKGNYCGDKNEQTCEGGFLLIPEQICISTCNTSIYDILNENENSLKKCGLCKDLYENQQFKLLDTDGCLKDKPNGTFYFSEELKILKKCSDNCKTCNNTEICQECNDGFTKNENEQCVKCFENCENCNQTSNDINDQKCTSCKKGLYFIKKEGNCVENCPENYNISGTNCIEYNGTDKPTDKSDDNDEQKDKSDDHDDDDGDKPDYMLWIFIIIFAILLILIALCILKRHCSRNKKDIEFINDINTELQENNRIIE